QPRRDRGRQACALVGAKIEDARDRSQETGRQRQGKFSQGQQDRGRRTEDAQERSQEKGRQRRGGVRQLRRGLASGGKVGPASRPRANDELNRCCVPALIFASMLLI